MSLKKYSYPVMICLIALAAWGCNKSGDAAPVIGPQSRLNVINAVTDIRAIDFYLNGTRQNTNSAIYLYNSSGYLNVLTGEQQYQFKSDTDRTVLADIKLNPAKKDSSYTLVAAGQQSNNSFSTIFLGDVFVTNSNAKNALVRFVQASPGTPSYDIFVGDTLSFKNKTFKDYTGFQGVGAGKKKIKVMLAGTTTPILTDSVIVQAGSYYTLLTRGSRTGSGKNAFGVSITLSR
ncbi:DUF4397 domain-containing protein [Mucilaginibacter mali]|uniref:DUF4397 domain-containing protein n=1 Tax=Mucilaginibacter mali TaxID=2740462 RepID=A0A7D4TQW8_9SPHI|nr:DUF4397 domain-containing protein [Mucilaginibacter mali]QKJ31694.1 DUF4397 domain-containing protein [Mucilaginibacter mali]